MGFDGRKNYAHNAIAAFPRIVTAAWPGRTPQSNAGLVGWCRRREFRAGS